MTKRKTAAIKYKHESDELLSLAAALAASDDKDDAEDIIIIASILGDL